MNVEWTESCKIGHETIDHQHKHLYELTNTLLAAQDVGAVRHAMVLLYKHTREHFDLEEALMRQYKYPELNAHTASHDSLLSRLNDISEEVGRGLMSRSALVELMGEWATHHMSKDDVKLAGFIGGRSAP